MSSSPESGKVQTSLASSKKDKEESPQRLQTHYNKNRCPKTKLDQARALNLPAKKKSGIKLMNLEAQTRKATVSELEAFEAFLTNKDFTSMPIASHVNQGILTLPEKNKYYVTEHVLKGTQCAGVTRKRLAVLNQGWYSIAMLVETKDITISVQNEVKRVDYYQLEDEMFVPHPKHIYHETEILRTVSLKRKAEVRVDASCQTTWTIPPEAPEHVSTNEAGSACTSAGHRFLSSMSHAPSRPSMSSQQKSPL